MYRLILLTVSLLPGVVTAQVSVGDVIPDIELQNMRGSNTSTHALFGDQGAAFVFWSNDCNWTDQYEARVEELNTESIPIILVNSNDATVFPKEAGPGKQYDVAYVRDLGGRLAQILGAERTPHVFVFDQGKTLVYAGGIDDSPADAQQVQAAWFKDAIEQLSGGESVRVSPTKSFGCRIKLP